jgi:hypothetical protein
MYKKYLIVSVMAAFCSQVRAMEDDIFDVQDLFEALRDSGIPVFGAPNQPGAASKVAMDALFLSAFQEFHTQNTLERSLKNTINARNDKGYTDLHLVVMHPDELRTVYPHVKGPSVDSERATYDKKHARLAAVGIKLGAKVDIKDGNQRTVSDIAEKNKNIFPYIYEVIMAGKVSQKFDAVQGERAKQSNPQDSEEYTKLCGELGGAMGTLDNYLDGDIAKEYQEYSSYVASIKK